ncbi:MAG: PilZ domain-containing protein [Deltaproteobacteria bacterium]|nr:PilZ domain-containing protein [Deltaproteobacteria bacterium]
MNDAPPGNDRRRYPRYSVRLDAAIDEAGRLRRAAVRDVSQGGAFVTTTEPAPVGTELKIRMTLPGAESEEALDGRVVRVIEMRGDAMPDHITGLGIEFRLSPEQRAKLRDVLLKYCSDSEPPPSDDGH